VLSPCEMAQMGTEELESSLIRWHKSIIEVDQLVTIMDSKYGQFATNQPHRKGF